MYSFAVYNPVGNYKYIEVTFLNLKIISAQSFIYWRLLKLRKLTADLLRVDCSWYFSLQIRG